MTHIISIAQTPTSWRVTQNGRIMLDTLRKGDALRYALDLDNRLDGQVTIRFD